MMDPELLPETEALHPVIAELLNTKFNKEYPIPAAIHSYRYMLTEFTRIASFSEAEAASIHELTFVPMELPEFKIRLYNAESAVLKPVLVYFHGGNWVGGDLETCDAVCRTLAEESNYTVVSVDYALAPEHTFPVPLYQGLEVIDWIRKQGVFYGIDHHKVIVGGDNAGGNIAACLVHLLGDSKNFRLFGQLLICPALNYSFDTPSYLEFDKGYLISREMMQNSWKTYLGNSDDAYNRFASLLSTANTSYVPPTLIYTAEYDPLRDEAEEYAACLKEQGITVSFHRFKGVTHHFWLMDGILNIARQAHSKASAFLLHQQQSVVNLPHKKGCSAN